jgi:hypothetical protein
LQGLPGNFGRVTHAQAMAERVRAWLIPASSEHQGQIVVPPEFRDAWTTTVREWDWQSPAIRERNISAIQSHYRADPEVQAGLPPALAVDWCREGRPEPSAWIEARLESILAEEGHRSVA